MNNSILKHTMPFPLRQDYTEVLDRFGAVYTCDDYYLKVDFQSAIANRVVFVSGVLSQLWDLVERVVPYLLSKQICFSLVKSQAVAKLVQNANFGEAHIGKLFLIYLSEAMEQNQIVQDLVALTEDFQGPAIPGHQFRGGLVYTKYPATTSVPAARKSPMRLLQNYLITAQLKHDAKGDVYRALYLNKFLIPNYCVIKQARFCMWSDEDGRDVQDRLKWQCEIHKRLSSFFNIPKIIDEFKEKGDQYLVMEYIKGKPFNLVLEGVYQGRSWATLPDLDQLEMLVLLNNLFEMVNQLHTADYVHRDLTPGNFILKKSGELYMIDLELLYDLKSKFPTPVFTLGTAGFMSPEQWMADVPTPKEDIYALGGFMIMCFTGLAPAKFELEKRSLLSQRLTELKVDHRLIKMIMHCVESEPDHRPSIVVLIKMLEDFLNELNWPELDRATRKARFRSSLIYKSLSHDKSI